MTHANQTTRRLIVLGSTGSIGVNTLNVVANLNRVAEQDATKPRFEVVGLAAGSNADRLIAQARQFNVKAIAVADTDAGEQVRAALPDAAVYIGPDAAEELVDGVEATDTAAAMVGAAGLPATIAAIRKGQRISLANKETLVAAGSLVTALVRKHGATLIPVDSEHSAIFQCLYQGQGPGAKGQGKDDGLNSGFDPDPSAQGPRPSALPRHPPAQGPRPLALTRIVLTASGGPFRTATKEAIDNATVEQALDHPTWNMGPKITIDSASMMNKALEIIEAHWLFDLPGEKIDVIVHPQSIVHSFVEFVDGSVLAQLGPPDMQTPIQYALTYPDRSPGCSEAMDWRALSNLIFEPPDFERFGSLKLAFEVIEAGGTAGAVFNAANEAAVGAFLEGRIRFGQIVELVREALGAIESQPLTCLDEVYEADRRARAYVANRIGEAVEPLR